MPKHEIDPEDPLELACVALDDPDGRALREMAECLADEFLRLGHSRVEVLRLFRDPLHSLAYRAWLGLGEVHIHALVSELAQPYERLREIRARAAKEDSHV